MTMPNIGLVFVAALSAVNGFGTFGPALKSVSSPSASAVRVSESLRCRRLQLYMQESTKRERPLRLLGSKRLQYIRETLKKDPANFDSSKKLLGSRRMALVIDTLVSGVEHTTDTKAIRTSSLETQAAKRMEAIDAAAAPLKNMVAEETVEMTDSVEQTTEIDATPAQCYQIAAKLEDYPKWVASLESVEVLDAGNDGLARQAKFAVGAFGRTLDYTLEYTHKVPEKLAWKAIAGSVKALVGSYSFEALDGGKRTRVTYKLALDPGFPIPGMIKKASTKLIVRTALNDLRKYTEKPATKEMAQELVEKAGTAKPAGAIAAAGKKEENIMLTDSVEESMDINASPELCYRVAADFDEYPNWVGSLKSVEVLDMGFGNLASQVKFAIGAFGQTLDYTLEYTHKVPEKLAWEAIAGSVKALVGSYSFEALDGGKRTRVTYKLALDPGFPVPGMIKKASTKLIVSTALNDLRKYAEKPDTQARVGALLAPFVEAEKMKLDTKSKDTTQKTATQQRADDEKVASVQAPVTDDIMMDSVTADILVDATPEECYQVAVEFEDYPKWVGSLQYCKQVDMGPDSLARLVEFKVGAFGQTLDYTLEYRHTVPSKLTWKAVSGSVKALVGSYTFEPVDGGKKARVTYSLALDPGFPVPGMIKKATTKIIVGTALNDLRKYCETPETKDLVRTLLAQSAAVSTSSSSSTPNSVVAPAADAEVAVEMTDSVERTIEIDATPAQCYQVAAKLEDYPKWVASLESVEVLDAGNDGLARQAKFAVGAFGRTLDYTLEYTHKVPEKLAWKAIAGSVKALVGSYSFEALDGGKRTRVTYKLALDPGFPIPGMIKKASTKLIASTALNDLRKYTEKPSTKALFEP